MSIFRALDRRISEEPRVRFENVCESRTQRASQFRFACHDAPELLPRRARAMSENSLAHPSLETEELDALSKRGQFGNSRSREIVVAVR